MKVAVCNDPSVFPPTKYPTSARRMKEAAVVLLYRPRKNIMQCGTFHPDCKVVDRICMHVIWRLAVSAFLVRLEVFPYFRLVIRMLEMHGFLVTCLNLLGSTDSCGVVVIMVSCVRTIRTHDHLKPSTISLLEEIDNNLAGL